MSKDDPLAIILAARQAARLANDANADLSFLAIASTDGKASVRTLVLRDITDNRFSLFINESSPKWQLLAEHCHYELLLWYPSQQMQIRIQGDSRPLDKSLVHQAWQNKPEGAKYIDYAYESLGPQSSSITSRQQLTDEIVCLKELYPPDTLSAPDQVAGIELLADEIEILDLSTEDRIHHRQKYKLLDDHWCSEVMVP